MDKLFVNFLPPWVETNIQPAFYDKESGSVLQQTARMYAKVNCLVRMFNKLSKETKETVEDYIARFVALKDFVDTYFENLDVQEEINNKLDKMAEDGTLQEIISSYLNATAVWGFDSVADMKASTNLIEGSYAQTLGYYSKEDGGAGLYKIVDSEDVANDRDIIALTSGLKAILVPIDFNVYPEQFGAKGDYDTDDATAINATIQYAYTKGYKVILGKSYEISSPIVIDQNNLVIDIRNKINYTVNTSAVIITSNYNVMNFNKIYSSGKGITFNKSVKQAGALEGNRLNVEYINSTDNCIEMISTAGGLVYNEVRFTTLVSSSAHDNIYLSATGSSYVGENTFYGGKCQRGTWGVYATSDHSGGIPVVKLYNLCFEGVTNGIYFNNVLASTINYPRYAELEQNDVTLWSINGNTTDCVFNGNHPVDLSRVVANSSATSPRFNYINAPIMNTGGTTIAKRAGVNKNGFALEPHCVKYCNVTSSWATHTIDETEFQPQYFHCNFDATITLNNSYIPEFIPFFYVKYDGTKRLTIVDQNNETVHDGTGLPTGLYKVHIYQDHLITKYFTTTETLTS